MDWVRVETERLALAVVVSSEGALEVLKRRGIVDFGLTVGGVAGNEIRMCVAPCNQIAYSQGSIKWGPSMPRWSNWAYMGSSQKPGSLGSPLQMLSTWRQSFAMPLSRV